MNTGISRCTLQREANAYVACRNKLLSEVPDLDAETLGDTLQGMTDLVEMLEEVVRSALEDEALAVGLNSRLSDMKRRHERLELRATRKRHLVLRVMSDAALTRLAAADFTASLKQGAPTLDVVSEEKIPAAYWRPQPAKLDKLGLLAALKSGTAIDGAALCAPQNLLSIRTK